MKLNLAGEFPAGFANLLLNVSSSDSLDINEVALTSVELTPLFPDQHDINPYVFYESNGYIYTFRPINESRPVQDLDISGNGNNLDLVGFKDGDFGTTLSGTVPDGIGAFGAVDPSYYTDTHLTISVADHQFTQWRTRPPVGKPAKRKTFCGLEAEQPNLFEEPKCTSRMRPL